MFAQTLLPVVRRAALAILLSGAEGCVTETVEISPHTAGISNQRSLWLRHSDLVSESPLFRPRSRQKDPDACANRAVFGFGSAASPAADICARFYRSSRLLLLPQFAFLPFGLFS